jgi:hypothetical protein
MVSNNNSILHLLAEDNYILSTKDLEGKATKRRKNNSPTQINDGSSDTSSTVKEKK